MSQGKEHATPQEQFWAGEFGTDYIARNQSDALLASNLAFFSKALDRAGPVKSCAEIGANVGMNLKALRMRYPGIRCTAAEINPNAASQLAKEIGEENVFVGSIADWTPPGSSDLSLSKGVLIHLAPALLETAYRKLYEASARLILIAEYYSPAPASIPYRGHDDRLFKRDFAGDMLDAFSDLRLLDYGFSYHRDPAFPQDDINWFLLEKAGA
jgi:pseudaminic acid biosynthesis-associated methylase